MQKLTNFCLRIFNYFSFLAGRQRPLPEGNPFVPTGSRADSDDEEGSYFNLPKLQSRRHILKARWNDGKEMAEVVEIKGCICKSMGIVREGKIYFSIEETLYLAERGELNLSNANNKTAVSIKDLYKNIAQEKSGCCSDAFQAYKHLRSLGHVIKRHGIPWTMKINEKKTDSADKYLENEVISNIGISDLRPAFDVYPPNSEFRKTCPGEPSFVLCIISGEPPSKQEIEGLERRCNGIRLKLCHVDHERVSFFNFDKVELPLLP